MRDIEQRGEANPVDKEDAALLVNSDNPITLNTEAYDAFLAVINSPIPPESAELLARKAVWE